MSQEPVDPHAQPTLDDVMDVEEPATPHHRAHGKASRHPDERELEKKVEIEAEEVRLEAN